MSVDVSEQARVLDADFPGEEACRILDLFAEGPGLSVGLLLIDVIRMLARVDSVMQPGDVAQRVRDVGGVKAGVVVGDGGEEVLLGLERVGEGEQHAAGVRLAEQEGDKVAVQNHPCLGGGEGEGGDVGDGLVGVRVDDGALRVVEGERGVRVQAVVAEALAVLPPVRLGEAEEAAVARGEVAGA